MAFFMEKVRRVVPGNFTFLVMTDREDLDDQIWRTFVGCGIVDPRTTPRAANGKELKVAASQTGVEVSVPAEAPDKIASVVVLKIIGTPEVN